MATAELTPAFQALALQLQEAAMMHGEVRSRLSTAIDDAHKGSGAYAYYLDHTGDGDSGDVIFSSGSATRKAPYSTDNTGGKAKTTIDLDKAKKVVPMTTYKDHVAESATPGVSRGTGTGVRLVESAAFAEGTEFREASTVNPLAKIISPGRGSSGYYTKEMLQRDGPKVFKRGTLMYINHATAAEEAARPEGDWSKLAAVTEGDAYWDENGKGGAALYAPVKVFAEYATQVAEKAPYTGVSIRATGHYAESTTGRVGADVTLAESKMAPDGKPGLIGALTEADSIDLVTRAGRDGKLFLESATNQGEPDMDKAAIEALIKENLAPLQAENARLRETISRQRAPQAIAEALREIRLPGPMHVVEATRMRIIKTLTPHVPLTEAGKFDTVKLAEMVEAEAIAEAQYLQQMGFGGSDIAQIGKRMTEAEMRAAEATTGKEFETRFAETMESLADIFVGKKLKASGGPAAEYREDARKSFIEGKAA